MLIIPTEKRLDWRRPPVVLFLLVILNVCIYFFYQADDEQKYQQAVEQYHALNYFDAEWPVFVRYMEQQGRAADEIDLMRKAYESGDHGQLYARVLLDQGFLEYLNYNAILFNEPGGGEYWDQRRAVDAIVQSASLSGYGLKPNQISIVNLFSHQFLHGGIMHLVGNMVFLVLFGFAVEAAIGSLRFLTFYLLAGMGGGLLYALINQASGQVLVGASGSISGVMAMYLGIYRLRKIEFFYWFAIFIGFIRAPALLVLPLYIGNELYQFFSQPDSNVAFMAHTGGFVVGVLLIIVFSSLDQDVVNKEYLEAHLEDDQRQKELDKIYKLVGLFAFERALAHIDQFIHDHGRNFELELLRYRVLKQQGADCEDALLCLLNTDSPNPSQLRRIEDAWSENSEIQARLPAAQLQTLGWRFLASDDLKTAEAILKQLIEREHYDRDLGLFAQKLAMLFEKRNSPSKAKRYGKVAEKLSQGNQVV